jgi:hypothetical protein
MALSKDDEIRAILHSIGAEFEADPHTFIASTSNLTSDDHELVGRLIQLYCFADYNARRVIDTVREAAKGPEARNGSRLAEPDFFDHLEQVAQMLPEGNVKEVLSGAAAILNLHRDNRHHFAHWAARRLNGRDVLILFSKNYQQGKKRTGDSGPDAYETVYGLVPMPEFRRELDKLDHHAHNVSVLAPDLENRIDELRSMLAELRASRPD